MAIFFTLVVALCFGMAEPVYAEDSGPIYMDSVVQATGWANSSWALGAPDNSGATITASAEPIILTALPFAQTGATLTGATITFKFTSNTSMAVAVQSANGSITYCVTSGQSSGTRTYNLDLGDCNISAATMAAGDIRFRFSRVSGTHTANVDAAWLTLYGGGSSSPPLSFENLTGTSVDVDEPITWRASWSNWQYPIMKLAVYKQSYGTGSLGSQVTSYEYTNVAGTGSVNFTGSYDVTGTYTPILTVSNCSNGGYVNGSGSFIRGAYTSTGAFIENPDECIIEYLEGDAITVGSGVQDLDTTYSFYFEPDTLSQSYETNENIDFSYIVDPALCVTGISSMVAYFGYPPQYAAQDIGVPLATLSGSISINYPFSSQLYGKFYPYIKLNCVSGGGPKIYNNSTLYASRASGIFTRSPTDAHYLDGTPTVEVGTKGGKSSDYSSATGSGAYFFTDKDQYDKTENVKLRVYFGVGFTVGSVRVYNDITKLPSQYTDLTGVTQISNRQEHIYNISYSSSGQYVPMVEVRSTTYSGSIASTYRRIYLGGETYPQPDKYIIIRNRVAGYNELISTSGVFGLDPSTFSLSFGDSDNEFLQFISFVATYVARAGLYVASFIFSIIESAPIFSMIPDMLTPDEGCYQSPSTLFTAPLPLAQVVSNNYCVTYADENIFVTSYLYLAIFASFVMLFLRKFIP